MWTAIAVTAHARSSDLFFSPLHCLCTVTESCNYRKDDIWRVWKVLNKNWYSEEKMVSHCPEIRQDIDIKLFCIFKTTKFILSLVIQPVILLVLSLMWNKILLLHSHLHFIHLAVIKCSLFFAFQGDIRIHMIYKSAGQEGFNDGMMFTKAMWRI